MAKSWYYIVEEPRRSEILREYGIPESVIHIGCYEKTDKAFQIHCQEPHRSSDDQSAEGDLVVSIYETDGDGAYACRKIGDQIEFVEFSAEEPDDIVQIALTVQGFLADLFVDLVYFHLDDGGDPKTALAKASASVGFRYLDETIAFVLEELEKPIKGYRERRHAFFLSLQ